MGRRGGAGQSRRSSAARQALALGALQGPTELLPISSSAHTRLLPWLAGWSCVEEDPSTRKSLEAALHMSAAVALAIDMRSEITAAARTLTFRRAAAAALSLAPAIGAGYAFEGSIERRLGGPRSIAAGLILGAMAMAAADIRHPPYPPTARRERDAGPIDGLALGLAQATALMPGVSRNGATLTAARARGFAREDAHALSWHAALPVMFGAGVLKGWRLLQGKKGRGGKPAHAVGTAGKSGGLAPLAWGAGGAFVSTLMSARLLRRPRVSRRSLAPWAAYRCALAAVALVRAGRDAGEAQNMRG